MAAVFGLVGAVFFAQANAVRAEEMFKSSDFLTWKRANQEFYINTSIGMASLIASQLDTDQSKCISHWMATDEQLAYDQVLSSMKQFPDYHPRGVILAVIERRCGKFERR